MSTPSLPTLGVDSRTLPVEAINERRRRAVMVERPRRPAGTGRTLTAEQEREVQRLN